MKRRSRGQSLVETTVILAAFMGLLLGMVGIGGALFARQTLAARTHEAARWGALHDFDPDSVRNLVLYGTPDREPDAASFLGLSSDDVEIARSGCPGPDCRISVAIARHGIRSVEPMECANATCDAPAKP